jgi:hypothetical protein
MSIYYWSRFLANKINPHLQINNMTNSGVSLNHIFNAMYSFGFMPFNFVVRYYITDKSNTEISDDNINEYNSEISYLQKASSYFILNKDTFIASLFFSHTYNLIDQYSITKLDPNNLIKTDVQQKFLLYTNYELKKNIFDFSNVIDIIFNSILSSAKYTQYYNSITDTTFSNNVDKFYDAYFNWITKIKVKSGVNLSDDNITQLTISITNLNSNFADLSKLLENVANVVSSANNIIQNLSNTDTNINSNIGNSNVGN